MADARPSSRASELWGSRPGRIPEGAFPPRGGGSPQGCARGGRRPAARARRAGEEEGKRKGG